MKKIIILILINLTIILVGWNFINKKSISNTLQTVAVAGMLPGISDLAELPISIAPIDPSAIIDGIVPQNVDPNQGPSSKPIILLNIWLTSGYSLQPNNQYTVVGKSKTLYTDSGRSIWEGILQPLATPHYVWYQSPDKKNWTKLSSTDQYLTITPSQVGTIYYKQATVWYWKVPTALDTVVYSNLAFITTFPGYHDADSLEVKADSNYLYNNQKDAVTTFVRGYPSPENSTGNITWSINDTSLAKVDSRTGLVTANNNGKSGTVTVTGTMSNVGKPAVKNTVDIRIGGGLDDKQVEEGNRVEFNIQGKFDQKPTSVSWHQVTTTGKDIVVDSSGNNMSYTISKATYADNNTKYYAVMTIHGEKRDETITTNRANLSVIKDQSQDIKMVGTIFNNDKNNHDEENTVLGGVAKGNKLTFKLNVTDDTLNFPMVDAVIGLKVPKTMDITAVRLDGQDKSALDISSMDDPDNNNGYIGLVKNIDFSSVRNHVLEIDGTVGDMDKLDLYTSMFIFSGIKSNGATPAEIYSNPLTWYLGDNLVSLKAHDWQYPTVNSTSKATLLRRIKMTNNALDITDDRTDKKSAQLYLKQPNSFKSGSNLLTAEIRYYRKNGSFTKLDKDGIIAEETVDGETLKSIAWSPDEGPLLYIYGGDKAAGTYSTGLEWSLVQSIPNTNTPTKINS